MWPTDGCIGLTGCLCIHHQCRLWFQQKCVGRKDTAYGLVIGWRGDGTLSHSAEIYTVVAITGSWSTGQSTYPRAAQHCFSIAAQARVIVLHSSTSQCILQYTTLVSSNNGVGWLKMWSVVPAQGSYNWKLLLWVKGVETTILLLLTLLEKPIYRGGRRYDSTRTSESTRTKDMLITS